jgi:hypothetical protein
MLRKILGVIAAYVVMMILTFILLTVLYNVLGADGVFGPGNYQPTLAWLAGALIVTVLVTITGGYIAAVIGKGGTAKILALVVIVVGLIMAAATILGPMKMPEARPAVITMFEAIAKMQEPVWVCLVNPVIGAIGVLIGGKFKKS